MNILWIKHKALFQVNRLSCPVVGTLSPPLALKVFQSQIFPILEYGAEIWSKGKQIDNIEVIQLKFVTNVLSVKPQTTTDAGYAETGRLPLVIRHKLKFLKYQSRVISLPDSHVVKKAYNFLLVLESIGQTNW